MKTMKTVRIEVKASDIKLGTQGNASTCAISRAAKRMFKGKDVETGIGSVTVRNGETVYYMLPAAARKFIERFDEDKKSVKPFSFTMKLSNGGY